MCLSCGKLFNDCATSLMSLSTAKAADIYRTSASSGLAGWPWAGWYPEYTGALHVCPVSPCWLNLKSKNTCGWGWRNWHNSYTIGTLPILVCFHEGRVVLIFCYRDRNVFFFFFPLLVCAVHTLGLWSDSLIQHTVWPSGYSEDNMLPTGWIFTFFPPSHTCYNAYVVT